MINQIRIVGARTHNLKAVNLEIPHDRLTVITGVSGSGKSSLAIDTLYAEGQRQYIESLSTYARQFLNQLQRPEVESIEGLQPTLCIDQKVGSSNPRSTVATVTEVYDYLRLLLARVGSPTCYACGKPIIQQSADQILSEILALPEGTKLVLMAPMVRGRRGAHLDELNAIRKAGLVRVRVDNELFDVENVPELGPRKNHTIEAVVDKIVVRPGCENRLANSIQVALSLATGVVSISYLTPEAEKTDAPMRWVDRLFSTLYACPDCGVSYEEVEPRTFSFNSPYGACPECDGIGSQQSLTCPACGGARLRKEALSVGIDGKNVHDICSASICDVLAWIEQLDFPLDRQPIARPIITEMLHRLRFLVKVGVGYLTLGRPASSLSGGELQRVRLATSIGSGLVGVCYILDEPSIGLHQRDNDRLIESLRDLQIQGNTVIVVEHDEAMMRAADCLVDVGPGAGIEGGQIICMGAPSEVEQHPDSITAKYLRGDEIVARAGSRRTFDRKQQIELKGATLHNLKNVDVNIPLGLLVGITGVSGSGKSSLIGQTLIPALAFHLKQSTRKPTHFQSLRGYPLVDKLIEITQTPIGRSPRSTPATYCGVFDLIRAVWANTRDAKQRGFSLSRFSFNAGSGRCPQCQGQGQEKIEMNFLPDLYVNCSICSGSRFNRQTLQVRYREKSIADILAMSVDQACDFFANFTKIHQLLNSLRLVGLGYLCLGQSSSTLSGGESQRIKLATELARSETGKTIYFLDEPTTGLHFADVKRLIGVLDGLVQRGNTVIVIEHNLDVIKSCDWLIDLGPEGGDLGGEIIASGTPEDVAASQRSLTGGYLHPAAATTHQG